MNENNLKPIVQEIEYGKIVVNLDKLMADKDVTTYALNSSTNIRFQTIQSLKENTATRIDFNVLAKICYTMGCNVADVLEYVPNDK